jgi:hypothetical protein
MLAEAHRTGRPQGPESGEWPLPGPGGLVVRVSSDVRVIPCEGLLLIGWERGHESRTAQEAQRLVGVCWAEWSLGDGSVEGSSGLRGVLGLTDTEPLPDLLELGRTVTPQSLDALYRAVHDLLQCSEIAECDRHLAGPKRRILRFVGEPVRLAAGPVWALRAVLHDVTEDRRSRALAERATREAQVQRERATRSRRWPNGSGTPSCPGSPGSWPSTASRRPPSTGPRSTRRAWAATGTRPGSCPRAGC